jgi:SAM-dependent MidA family methyltransferase
MQPSDEAVRSAIIGALRDRAGGRDAVGFDEFMEVALYAPEVGYYRRDAERIGRGPGTDFLTATASAPLFGRLVADACSQILPRPPSSYDFVEVGAERGRGILSGFVHPFRSARTVGIGEPIALTGNCVVFSNELFDAQPFRRFRRAAGAWIETGVEIAALREVDLGPANLPEETLPAEGAEGARFDAPIAATKLCGAIAAQEWEGLFLAFDYGRSWEQLAHDAPAGTARAYFRHAQVADLLERPGCQDLTCHVCWDWLSAALAAAGFQEPALESQEAFFIRRAEGAIKGIFNSGVGALSGEAMGLKQLLHPSNLGQKFQALWALRTGQNPLA